MVASFRGWRGQRGKPLGLVDFFPPFFPAMSNPNNTVELMQSPSFQALSTSSRPAIPPSFPNSDRLNLPVLQAQDADERGALLLAAVANLQQYVIL